MKNSILRNKNFLCLLLGKFISLTGTQIQNFAISLYVLKITGSAAKFASVLAVTVIPQIILGPICGVFADWFNRKKMMIILDTLSGVIVLSMGIIYKIKGILPMYYIFFSVIVLSIVSLLYNAASSAVIPSIVDKDKLLNANSVNSTVSSIPQVIGPLLSGIVYGFFGIFPVIIINSASFLISALTTTIIDIQQNTRKNLEFNFKQFKADFKDGVIFIKSTKNVLRISVCGFFINFALDPVYSTGLPYICKKVILLSDAKIGTVESIVSIGIFIGAVLPGIVQNKITETKVFGIVITVSGAIVLTISGTLILFYNKIISNITIITICIAVLFFIMISLIIICNIILATIFQKETPLEYMGRASSVLNTVCTAAMPAGQMIIGSMFDYTKAYIPTAVAGAIILISGVIYAIVNKSTSIIPKKICKNA